MHKKHLQLSDRLPQMPDENLLMAKSRLIPLDYQLPLAPNSKIRLVCSNLHFLEMLVT
ncbi:hypothetical protein H6G81_07600 [Scytonema hofmannii FACHB-248]|uniref:Uncharacterized protein n=1 Tax=Scytonema hofmannii FACHB-248 TaxID=1842502 RepID=A0ABR8GLW1_9CYAN|nr:MULTISPECIES: hypothetical protein [Nostocales]MBD2604399.1 hypothetical protein [Scytonema hofmannii FACHB-248]